MPHGPAPGASTRHVPQPAEIRERLRCVRDLVRYAVTRLGAAGAAFGQGTDNAFDEACWLVLWALHLPPDRLDPFLDAAITPSEAETVLDLIERRCTERIPAAYLTGEAWLQGLRFAASPAALIPRSLLAEAVDPERLEPWIAPAAVGSILDLCTGGGSLAVLAALRFPAARVTATDLSRAALTLAARNVADHGLQDRIELLRGDLFEAVGPRRFDLVICNPPYVNSCSMRELPPEFRHEPRSALNGGTDGMDLIRRIVGSAAAHLQPGGVLLLEIGHEAEHFAAAFADLEFTYLPVTAGDEHVVLIERDAVDPERPQ